MKPLATKVSSAQMHSLVNRGVKMRRQVRSDLAVDAANSRLVIAQ
jgi:hypothetical protein